MRAARPALLLALACAPGAAFSAAPAPVKAAALLLPKGPGVSVEWVLAPQAKGGLRAARVFCVDARGRPWLGDGRSWVSCPTEGVFYRLDLPYDDFTALDGALVFSARGALAAALPGERARFAAGGVPLFALAPLLRSPLRRARLFPASSGGLYLAGLGPGRRGTLYYLPAARSGRRVFRRLFRGVGPLGAVAGDGSRAFVAYGRLVMELDGTGPVRARGLFKARGPVRDLAWVPGAGLAYATDTGCGFYAPDLGRGVEFLRAPRPRLFAAATGLYVYLPSVLGVARLRGLARFRSLLERGGR